MANLTLLKGMVGKNKTKEEAGNSRWESCGS